MRGFRDPIREKLLSLSCEVELDLCVILYDPVLAFGFLGQDAAEHDMMTQVRGVFSHG
jgi:hypothetical protein